MSNYKRAIDQISRALENSKDLYLSSHIDPDGDSIGSLMSLGLALEQLGKNVHFIKTDTIPKTFNFLPQIDRIKDYNDINPDILFILDSGNKDRIGEYEKYIELSKVVVNIDHHLDNNNYGDINLVDDSRASTGEIVFDLIEGLNLEFNKDIASYLYTAISMDSGSFTYDKVNSRTHDIISRLIKEDIDKTNININLYQNRSMSATKLFIEGLSTMKTYENDKIATIKVTQDMVGKNKANIEDTNGLISFIRDIDTVEVAALLKEMENKEVKISLRSKSYVNVSAIGNKFNGGGHNRAAGCTIYEDIDSAEKLIVEEIKRSMENKDEWNN